MLEPGTEAYDRWLREALRFLTQQELKRSPGYRRTPKGERPRCGARCRDGHPCQAPAVWDRANDRPRNGRCRLHGGCSTGPRTPDGRRRSREGARKGGRVSAERRRRGLSVAPSPHQHLCCEKKQA